MYILGVLNACFFIYEHEKKICEPKNAWHIPFKKKLLCLWQIRDLFTSFSSRMNTREIIESTKSRHLTFLDCKYFQYF